MQVPEWLSEHVSWARPLTFAYIVLGCFGGAGHFAWRHRRRGGWRQYFGSNAVRQSSGVSTWHIGPDALLLFRAGVFVGSFWTLMQSSFYEGPQCLRFFTVWNFIAFVAFFALGTALSCECCREVGAMRRTPSALHRLAAAAHHLLLEVQLPMSAMITLVVWLVLYPYDVLNGEPAFRLAGYTNLTSLTMHVGNFVFMLIEFGLDALHLTPGHFGLVLFWGMLYALFNGLQAYWTHDTVYFFMDFTLAKTPFVALGLTVLMFTVFAGACALSRLKWRLVLGQRDHPADPHRADVAVCSCGDLDDDEEAVMLDATARRSGGVEAATAGDDGAGADGGDTAYQLFVR